MSEQAKSGEKSSKDSNSDYRMTVSLNVLRHLGLNLYSKVPAVLSEAVANAWDADAETVDIDIDPDEQEIAIKDDGHGMSSQEVNERYLYVGYQRREDEDRDSTTEKFDRPVMGRKGIGKLSLFSIANVVEVYTTDGNDENAFRMVVEDMKEKMEEQDAGTSEAVYHPDAIDAFPEDLTQGTRVVLKDLKKTIYTNQTAGHLKKRLARRFGIIGEEYYFSMYVNGEEVTIEDRDYFHKIQYLWHYGEDSKRYKEYCRDLEESEKRENTTESGYEVEGWIGTVDTFSDLKDGDEDLNKISVMMRGKLAQEDILEDTNIGGLFSKYVIGVIHADFMDIDEAPDMATSSRERLFKEDPRYEELREFVEEELKHIDKKWNTYRNEEGAEEARKIEEVDEWFTSLSEDNQERARDLFGTLHQMAVGDSEDKRRMFKHGVLAFESLRYRDSLDKLDKISTRNVEQLTEVFGDLDDIEASLYHQIVTQRLEVIEELNKKLEEDAIDEVLQRYLYEHPWLLDPSWERATGANELEERVRKEFNEVDSGLPPEKRKGRVEVKYMKTTGQHVIIDLRDATTQFSREELVNQLSEYKRALRRVLKEEGRGGEDIEIVSVVGEELEGRGEEIEETRKILDAINARVVKYEELLRDAEKAYKQYMANESEADKIQRIIDSIDASDVF